MSSVIIQNDVISLPFSTSYTRLNPILQKEGRVKLYMPPQVCFTSFDLGLVTET